jgi:ABC-2 type transport system ATP-binding protein
MIQVEQLTKRFGDRAAIDNVSFQVNKGEVVGFLGPNGAGKSTTMRILTGCIGATSGRALIGGRDVLEDPQGVKGQIGYLPEVPPVYGSMTIGDYVAFAAKLKGVSDAKGAADRVMDKVGLGKVKHRVIDHLSKGYRQRVGIAQAMVHDPAVLVLDEPTSGLDPAQRKEIRDLLAELAEGDRTVILSTHVLTEIEAICERVIIINEGRIVAMDSIENLAAGQNQVRVRVARPSADFEAQMSRVPGVSRVVANPDGTFTLGTQADVREAIAGVAVRFGLLELSQAQRLEDIYIRLTTGGDA